MLRVLTWTAALVVLGTAAVRYSLPDVPDRATEPRSLPGTWIDHLYSQNPKEAAAAAEYVTGHPREALDTVIGVFRDPESDRDRQKAALKACGLLGPAAAPAVPEAAELLYEPDLAAEAAAALSYMGDEAFAPLREALSSREATTRREALRAIGKLASRAPLEPERVVPILIHGMSDPDGGVRAVAATYLGIVRSGAHEAIPSLIRGLEDSDAAVRLSSAQALEAFGPEARPALPALRRALTDPDRDVAREAGRAVATVSSVR